MRTFLSCVGIASSFMAVVSLVLGALGFIDPVDTLVFVLTFIGLHVLILWELDTHLSKLWGLRPPVFFGLRKVAGRRDASHLVVVTR